MNILQRLNSAPLASDPWTNSRRGRTNAREHKGLTQSGLIAIIRAAAVLAGSLSLLSGSLALAQTTQSVSLAWDGESDPSVVGYNVHYGTSSNSLTSTLNVGASTT